MAVKVGINGFGRIGRLVFRAMCEEPERFDVVATNDLSDADMLAYLLKYDSTQGRFPGKVVAKQDALLVNGRELKVLSERDPAKLPWGKMGAEVVVECTGVFRTNKTDKKAGYDSHLDAGARKVIISAPTKGTAATIVLGVNDDILTPETTCVSNASCTTNSLAPAAKVLHENFGIIKGVMVTCHGYTSDQNIVDLIHKHNTRARAAAINIVPTTTGGREGPAGVERQARRVRPARAGAGRIDHRPDRSGGEENEHRRGERDGQGRRERTHEGHHRVRHRPDRL